MLGNCPAPGVRLACPQSGPQQQRAAQSGQRSISFSTLRSAIMGATFARPALALSLVLGAVLPGPAVRGESVPLKGNFTFHHSPPVPVSLAPLVLFVEGD